MTLNELMVRINKNIQKIKVFVVNVIKIMNEKGLKAGAVLVEDNVCIKNTAVIEDGKVVNVNC